MAKHGNVVTSVAEGNGVFEANAEVADDFVDAPLLGVAAGGDIDEGRMPTAHLATGKGRHHFRLLRFVEEGRELEDFLAVDGLVEGRVGDGSSDPQVFVEDLLHAFVGLADADGVLAHHDAGDAPLGTVAGKHTDVVGGDGTLVDYLIAHEAIGAVHRDITVYQSSFLQGTQVVDNDARTAGSDKDAVPLGLGGRQCLDGLGGYLVGTEADERSVDVEKQSFGHCVQFFIWGTKLKILGGII